MDRPDTHDDQQHGIGPERRPLGIVRHIHFVHLPIAKTPWRSLAEHVVGPASEPRQCGGAENSQTATAMPYQMAKKGGEPSVQCRCPRERRLDGWLAVSYRADAKRYADLRFGSSRNWAPVEYVRRVQRHATVRSPLRSSHAWLFNSLTKGRLLRGSHIFPPQKSAIANVVSIRTVVTRLRLYWSKRKLASVGESESSNEKWWPASWAGERSAAEQILDTNRSFLRRAEIAAYHKRDDLGRQ